jgi:hypothetical protein
LAIQLIFPPAFISSFSEVHEPIKPIFFINLIQLIALIILFRITRN